MPRILGFGYTQPNGTDTGIFVANNGPRVYTNMANRTPMSTRLTAVVVQNFYTMAVAWLPIPQRAPQP